MMIGLERLTRPPLARRCVSDIAVPFLDLGQVGPGPAGGIRLQHAVAHSVAQKVEPSPAAVDMQPAFRMHAFGVGSVEEVVGPGPITDLGGIGGTSDVRFAAAVEFDFRARTAVGTGDEQHGAPQWATAAAAAS